MHDRTFAKGALGSLYLFVFTAMVSVLVSFCTSNKWSKRNPPGSSRCSYCQRSVKTLVTSSINEWMGKRLLGSPWIEWWYITNNALTTITSLTHAVEIRDIRLRRILAIQWLSGIRQNNPAFFAGLFLKRRWSVRRLSRRHFRCNKNFTGCSGGVMFHLAVLAYRCHY